MPGLVEIGPLKLSKFLHFFLLSPLEEGHSLLKMFVLSLIIEIGTVFLEKYLVENIKFERQMDKQKTTTVTSAVSSYELHNYCIISDTNTVCHNTVDMM